MTDTQFVAIWIGTFAVIAACRILPAFVLRGRSLPPRVIEALGYIPSAAFAALVMNDLFSPTAFSISLWQGILPFLAATVVVTVGLKTRSMLLCCIAGVASFVLLSLV